jgi:hypothetical protein
MSKAGYDTGEHPFKKCNGVPALAIWILLRKANPVLKVANERAGHSMRLPAPSGTRQPSTDMVNALSDNTISHGRSPSHPVRVSLRGMSHVGGDG